MKLGTTLVIAIACIPLAAIGTHAQSPLDRAHAHNDYVHARPLLGALDRGFGSVEVDVHLVDGALLVAHDRDSARADRTLESSYLAPLRAWIAARGGHVYAGRPPLTLLIDVKSHADSTWAVLEPLVALPAQRDRWAALDGRLADLDAAHAPPAAAMPLVSADWKKLTNWRGRGAPPDSVRRRLASAAARAHAQGRRLRFWNTPDRPVVWRLLVWSGVDLIGADDLDGLRRFLADSP